MAQARPVIEARTGAVVPACLLAWLVPGAGHLYLGRTARGLVFMGAIGALFGLGVVMDARLQLYFGMDDILASLFSLAQMAMGVPYFLAKVLGYELGNVRSLTYEYGNTFTAVGGLLNILVILDAHDIAMGRKS